MGIELKMWVVACSLFVVTFASMFHSFMSDLKSTKNKFLIFSTKSNS